MNRKQLYLAAALMSASAMASTLEINIDCANPTVALSPHLYGLFFEDINFAADGGLYAELVQNRSFEYYSVRGNDRLGRSYHPLYAWEKVERGGAVVELSAEDSDPLNARNTNYLKVSVRRTGDAAGVSNSGFDGIPLDAGAKYDFSFHARRADWGGDGRIAVALETADGAVCGSIEFNGIGQQWKKHEGVIISDRTIDDARLVITTKGKGELYLDMVSLFPQDTFKGRRNGMRKDLAQALADLNPKFLRFPGGCIAHGDGLDNVYRWKDTVGDVAERKPNWNRWGYHQTYGLGYFEYFQLAEDIGATALPVIPVGVSCGFTPPQEAVPMDELGPWIQDALDLIEFANGPVSSTWGRLRAQMGHPEPFNLEFVALGNEPHDNALFRDRFPPFVKAIREKHPEIKIVGTSGLGWQIPIYDLMTEQKVYSSDEHYYEDPQWFLANTDRFDKFDRSKPLIFVGEYASRDQRQFNAVAEAAYLTGIERNGDMVDMTCYAPLLGNVLHSQWHPDLIYFDHRTIVKTPSYYVQQLFACNKGDLYLPATLSETTAGRKETLAGAVGVGTWRTAIEVEEVKINGTKVDTSEWQPRGGRFEIKNGLIRQSDEAAEAALCTSTEVFTGDTVTYTLRARKNAGNEGFLVQFGIREGQSDFWWNIGGWGNSRHALQMGTGRSRTEVISHRGSIETGKWYDIKIVMAPGNIKCYLDDELIHDYAIEAPAISISSTLDKQAGEVILKLVNPREQAVEATVNLNGVKTVAPEGTRTLLAADRAAMNTIQEPGLVKPETGSIPTGKSFACTLSPTSVQFIRVKVE